MNFSTYHEYPLTQNTTGNTSYQIGQSAAGQVLNGQTVPGVAVPGQAAAQAATQGGQVTASQTISGEIIAVDGNQVQIALDGGNVLSARLENEVALLLHSNMTFEISKGQDSTIFLKPLYTNTSTNSVLTAALTAAGLPVSSETQDMVLQLMQRGLPIDKDSLGAVYKDMNSYPQAEPADLIRLHAMQIPVNEATLEQLQGYQNLTNSLTATLQDVMEDTFQSIQSLTEGLNGETGLTDFARQLMAYLGEIQSGQGNLADSLPQGAAVTQGVPQQGAATQGDISQGSVAAQGAIQQGEAAQEAILGTTQQGIAQQGDAGVQGAVLQRDATAQGSLQQGDLMTQETTQQEINQPGITQQGDAGVQGAVPQEDAATQGANSSLELKTLQQLVQALTQHPQSDVAKEELLQNLKDLFGARWSIDPTEYMAKNGQEFQKAVQKLYQNVRDDLDGIAKAFEHAAKGESTVPKSVTNAQNNVSFLNQLNQTYTYLQLPLKLSGQYKNSELYVYTNKKSLAQKDGNVSAMLHLAMDHLGPVDVYVAMQHSHVSTKFYLQDEATIDFMAEHISLLDQRLQAKGYGFHAEMIEQKEKNEPVNPALEQPQGKREKKGTAEKMLSHVSFDMRA